MRSGWTKFHRSWLDDPLINKDPDHLAVWIRLVNDAALEAIPGVFGGKRITLQPGQLTTGRKQLGEKCGVQQDKVQRILRSFESAQLIAQQASSKNRLISILWCDSEDESAQQNALQMHNECTTSAQQMHTLERIKNKNKEIYTSEFLAFWDAYPKKEDKKRAAAKFATALKSGVKVETVMAGLEKAKRSEQWTERKYIPLPSTWLNGARWEDEADSQNPVESAVAFSNRPQTKMIGGVIHILGESGQWVPAEGDDYE